MSGAREFFDCECGDHSWGPLTRGYVTLVSQTDRDKASAFNWTASPRDRGVYVCRTSKRQTVYLHRSLFEVPEGFLIDHVNNNPLDNRRVNLRVASKAQNSMNARLKRGSDTPYKGVFKDRRREGGKAWRAQLYGRGVARYLGSYRTAEEAAEAYNRAAREAYGEWTVTNEEAR